MNQLATLGFPLSERQLCAYNLDGYLIERGVFSRKEIDHLACAADSVLNRRDLIRVDNLRCRWQKHVETDECLFETFDPVIDLNEEIAQVTADRRILDRLACIYDEEPCLFKDKLIFKPPGALGYDLHQDYIAWRDFPRSFVTVLVAIDPAGTDNGCTVVFPGYHKSGYLSAEDGDYHPLPTATVAETRAVPLDLEPGDVAFFGCFTPHRSSPNRSRRWRRQLYLSYNAISDGGQRRQRHYEEFHQWLRKKYAEHGKHNVYFR
jgi:hypothetical protein